MAIKFKNEKGLMAYTSKMQKHIPENEIAYCTDSKKTYVWRNEWQEIKLNTDEPLVEMSLYDLNNQLIAQMPDHNEEQLQEDIELINQYDNKQKSRFYMLLCKEYSYYTLFNYINSWANNISCLGKVVKECLDSVGQIRACDYDNIDNPTAVEIWVRTHDDEIHCFHLFSYDMGVVEFMRGE